MSGPSDGGERERLRETGWFTDTEYNSAQTAQAGDAGGSNTAHLLLALSGNRAGEIFCLHTIKLSPSVSSREKRARSSGSASSVSSFYRTCDIKITGLRRFWPRAAGAMASETGSDRPAQKWHVCRRLAHLYKRCQIWRASPTLFITLWEERMIFSDCAWWYAWSHMNSALQMLPLLLTPKPERWIQSYHVCHAAKTISWFEEIKYNGRFPFCGHL